MDILASPAVEVVNIQQLPVPAVAFMEASRRVWMTDIYHGQLHQRVYTGWQHGQAVWMAFNRLGEQVLFYASETPLSVTAEMVTAISDRLGHAVATIKLSEVPRQTDILQAHVVHIYKAWLRACLDKGIDIIRYTSAGRGQAESYALGVTRSSKQVAGRPMRGES